MVKVNGTRPQHAQGAGTASDATRSKYIDGPLHAGQPAGRITCSTRVKRVSRRIGPSHDRMYHDGERLPTTGCTERRGRLAVSHFLNRPRRTSARRYPEALLDLG